MVMERYRFLPYWLCERHSRHIRFFFTDVRLQGMFDIFNSPKGSLRKGLTDFLVGHNVRANQIFVSVSQSVGLYIFRRVDWWIKHASCLPGTTNNFKFRLDWKNVKIGKRMKRTHNMNVPGALQDKDIGLGPLGIS